MVACRKWFEKFLSETIEKIRSEKQILWNNSIVINQQKEISREIW